MDKNEIFHALGFDNIPNFIGHNETKAIFDAELEAIKKAVEAGQEPPKPRMLFLAKLVSKCLHEDWRQNVINEQKNNPDYQHFRPVKDAELTAKVLAEPEKYLKQTGERFENDPLGAKPLYRIVDVPVTKKEKQPDGTEKEVHTTEKQVQFDLMRMDFDNLTQKWQDANLDAAKFAVALINKALPQGALQGKPEKVFKDLEEMSHDVHIEWMIREQDWGSIELFFPYEVLTSSEQAKDTAQILSIIHGLSFRSDILAKNRSIVVRALKEVMSEYATDDGLKKEIEDNLESIQPIVDAHTKEIDERSSNFKKAVSEKTIAALSGKENLTFEDLEKISAIYYNEWRTQASSVVKLPAAYESSYENIPMEHARINFKSVARKEISTLVQELAKDGRISSKLAEDVSKINDPESEIAKRIAESNEKDLANYQAMKGSSGLQ